VLFKLTNKYFSFLIYIYHGPALELLLAKTKNIYVITIQIKHTIISIMVVLVYTNLKFRIEELVYRESQSE
jgi:hypothetical protein